MPISTAIVLIVHWECNTSGPAGIEALKAMNNAGRGNPEYMAVLSEVVACLFHQLHHPKLTMDARQITDWFHHVSVEEVQEVLEKAERSSSTVASQP